MFACSVLVIARRHSEYAVAGLIGVVITQALGYGLIFDLNFFLRNLSVMGGLLMVLSDSWVRKTKAFAGLPQLEEKDRKMYFQLAGRVLLIFLFIGFVFSGDWSVWRVIVSLLGLLACIMVVVGFKAKFSATLLVVILSIFNVLVNNFWTVSPALETLERERDANVESHSSTSTIPTRTSPSTTSSRSCLLSAACSSWSTAVPASSASTRRRRSTEPDCSRVMEVTAMYGTRSVCSDLERMAEGEYVPAQSRSGKSLPPRKKNVGTEERWSESRRWLEPLTKDMRDGIHQRRISFYV